MCVRVYNCVRSCLYRASTRCVIIYYYFYYFWPRYLFMPSFVVGDRPDELHIYIVHMHHTYYSVHLGFVLRCKLCFALCVIARTSFAPPIFAVNTNAWRFCANLNVPGGRRLFYACTRWWSSNITPRVSITRRSKQNKFLLATLRSASTNYTSETCKIYAHCNRWEAETLSHRPILNGGTTCD